MKNKILPISNPALVSMIHKACPEGVKYVSEVIGLAFELSEVTPPFYVGNPLDVYGVFPFLDVEGFFLEEGDVQSRHVIISSRLDKEAFREFVGELSISKSEKQDILKDLDTYYHEWDGLLDIYYPSLMRYLVEYLKCLSDRRDVRKQYLDILFDLPVGYSRIVELNSCIPYPVLCRKLKKRNRKHGKSSGKLLTVSLNKHLPASAVVSCVAYNGK